MKKTNIKLLAGLLAVSLLAGCGKAVKTEEKKEVSEKLVDVCEHFLRPQRESIGRLIRMERI